MKKRAQMLLLPLVLLMCRCCGADTGNCGMARFGWMARVAPRLVQIKMFWFNPFLTNIHTHERWPSQKVKVDLLTWFPFGASFLSVSCNRWSLESSMAVNTPASNQHRHTDQINTGSNKHSTSYERSPLSSPYKNPYLSIQYPKTVALRFHLFFARDSMIDSTTPPAITTPTWS